MIDWHALQVILIDVGGVAPTGLIALLAVVALGARGAWRRAAVFVAMVLLVVGIDVGSKLFYYGWGVNYDWESYRAASGHALRSAAVYPAFAWTVFSGSTRWRCAVAMAAGILTAAAVAFASVDNSNHTVAEVCVGGLLGLATPWVVARMGALKPLPGLSQAAFVVCAILLSTYAPAPRYDFEKHVQRIAERLR